MNAIPSGSELAGFNAGSGGFILQRYYQKEWAEGLRISYVYDPGGVIWYVARNAGRVQPRTTS